MKILKSALLLCALMIMGSTDVHAQQCPAPYAPRDRDAVQYFFSAPLSLPKAEGMGAILLRMHFLAQRVLLETLSSTQRSALNNEYLAWQLEINRLGYVGLPNARPRTNLFIARVINTTFLGLLGTTITANDNDLARTNAANASTATATAIQAMWSCF